MNTTFVTTMLTHVACYRCGMVFGIETSWNNRLIENHESFYCPSGQARAK